MGQIWFKASPPPCTYARWLWPCTWGGHLCKMALTRSTWGGFCVPSGHNPELGLSSSLTEVSCHIRTVSTLRSMAQDVEVSLWWQRETREPTGTERADLWVQKSGCRWVLCPRLLRLIPRGSETRLSEETFQAPEAHNYLGGTDTIPHMPLIGRPWWLRW